ncbi:MAG: polysaccharide deacetylase family protein [Filifactoraceae bacterium]
MKKIIVSMFLSLLIVMLTFTSVFADVNYTGVPILLYHHLVEDGVETSSVLKKSTFESHMKYLYDNGYTAITISRLEDYIDGKVKLPAKSVVITFDDGYRSNYEIAYPILKKYGFRSTQFVITSAIQDQPEVVNNDRLPHMSSGEMQLVKDVFDFQSHTHNLHKLNSNNKSIAVTSPKALITSDLILSNSELTKNGFPPSSIAYPYGMYNDDLKQAAKDSGLKLGFTITPARVNIGIDKMEIPRYNISEKTNFEVFKTIVDSDPNKIMPQSTITKPVIPTTPPAVITPTNTNNNSNTNITTNTNSSTNATSNTNSNTITITSTDPNTGKTFSYEVLVDQTSN